MALQLYFAPGACSFVPHTMLEAAGANFEPVLVKLHKGEHLQPAYQALNPRGQVPLLVVDGQPINQILAIVLYLDQQYPASGFLPTEAMARAQALQTLAWMNNTVHTTFAHIFLPHKFSDQKEIQAHLKQFNTQVYRGLLVELQTLVEAAQSTGRTWLSGGSFGPLDAYALTLTRWGGMSGIDPTSFGALWAHVQRVAAVPAVARVIERERLQLNVYQPA